MSPLVKRSQRRAAGALVSLLALGAIVGCSGNQSTIGSKSKVDSASGGPIAQSRPSGEPSAADKAPAADSSDELDGALDLARKSLKTLKKIRDYQCIFQRQERVGGTLLEETRMEMKVRQTPFSVYMRFINPPSAAGREVIYVEGANDGNLVAHGTGLQQAVGTVKLDPNGMIAMRGGRYPITDAGMTKLVEKLLALGAKKQLFQECRVSVDPIEFAERVCTRVEVRNPAAQGDFRLAIARIVLDDEWNVPVHFEAWEWPSEEGDEPILIERYSYLELRLDPGLTDLDFSTENPAYAFP